MEWLSSASRSAVGMAAGARPGSRPAAQKSLQDGVDEAAALAGVEAERGGFERGGEEALLGEGAEAAGGLDLRMPAPPCEDAVGWRRDGGVVGEGVESDGRRRGLGGSEFDGAAGFEREAGEDGRWALVAVGGLSARS